MSYYKIYSVKPQESQWFENGLILADATIRKFLIEEIRNKFSKDISLKLALHVNLGNNEFAWIDGITEITIPESLLLDRNKFKEGVIDVCTKKYIKDLQPLWKVIHLGHKVEMVYIQYSISYL